MKGRRGGRPLQALEMPTLYAFKVRDDDAMLDRGIELTLGRLYGDGKYIA